MVDLLPFIGKGQGKPVGNNPLYTITNKLTNYITNIFSKRSKNDQNKQLNMMFPGGDSSSGEEAYHQAAMDVHSSSTPMTKSRTNPTYAGNGKEEDTGEEDGFWIVERKKVCE